MTDITFYLIGSNHHRQRLQMTCQIAEKAYSHCQVMHIILDDPATTDTLDSLLWTYKDATFIPHNVLTDTSIAIKTYGQDNPPDLLINLTECVPNTYHQFKRVIEIIDQDPLTKQQGRKRYQYYKDQGLPITVHHLAK